MNLLKSNELSAQLKAKVKNKGAYRSKIPALWQFLIAALLFHVLLGLALSPNLGKGDESDVNVLIVQARDLVAKEKYDEAMQKYQRIINQKPQMPSVYVDAEREMNEARNKSVKAASQTNKADDKPKKPEDSKVKKPAEGDKKPPKKENPEITLPEVFQKVGP